MTGMDHFWPPVISALLGLILALLALQWKDQRGFNERVSQKLEKVVLKEDCVQNQETCPHGPGWKTFRGHSHTGLPPDSRVIG